MTLSTNSPNLGVLIDGAPGEQHMAQLMRQWRAFDGLIQCHVKDKDLATPPGSPADGDMYIVASSPTGAWSGQAGKLARWYVVPNNGSNGATGTSGWEFITPKKGWRVHVEDENVDYQYSGSAWAISSASFTGGTLTSALNAAPPVTLASAATVNIGAAAANTINITGTTTITAFDSIAAGARRTTIFAGVLTLTHNATSLILPGGANITTAAGDVAEWESLGSGNWKCIGYSSVTGLPNNTVFGAVISQANSGTGMRAVQTGLALPDYSGVGFGPSLLPGEYGRQTINNGANGGMAFSSFSTTATPSALLFVGHGGVGSASTPVISFLAFKHDGGTNRTALTGTEILAQFSAGATARLRALADGTWLPVGDNTQPLGLAANRWSVVYAGTGTINTSDAREKTEVRQLTSAEIAAAKQLAKEIGAFRFLAAIQDKGDDARTHIGMTVQRAIEIMEIHGLAPFDYGFICHDAWERLETEHPAEYQQIQIPAVVDENGVEIEPARVERGELISEAWVEVREAGDRYGFRTDELLLFVARGQADHLEQLEARINALEAL